MSFRGANAPWESPGTQYRFAVRWQEIATPLITHRYKLKDIEEAYRIFENKLDGVIKVAIRP